MRRSPQGREPAETAPTSDTAHGANVGRVEGIETDNTRDSAALPHAQQALKTIEGEEYARAFLDRLQAGGAQPGELAVILSFLTGELLHGACRVIEKTLGVRHE